MISFFRKGLYSLVPFLNDEEGKQCHSVLISYPVVWGMQTYLKVLKTGQS